MFKILLILCFISVAEAKPSEEFSQYFEVDLSEEFPPLQELEKAYIPDKSKIYDRGYDYYWNIGTNFDKAFRLVITGYGGSDKRVKHEDEEMMLKALNNLPKEMYPYIGPYLHTIPNMPEKILNLPGIKETKNKFPRRIAPQLEGVEDLEFLSPHLYILLMPEMWPENIKHIEIPETKISRSKVEFDPKFFEVVNELVPEEDFYPDAKPNETPTNSDLRTMNVTADSPLTSADVKAFAATLGKVNEFSRKPRYAFNLHRAGFLIDSFEASKGAPPLSGSLKDVVAPCKRMVQKVRLLGLENEFQMTLGEDGFDLNSWAYTCDKTIKAYRVATLKLPMVNVLSAYKKGLLQYPYEKMGMENTFNQYLMMESLVEMYNAPINDVLEVRKNKELLSSTFKNLDWEIGVGGVAQISLIE